jgi:HrpA-like RNA helicase
MKLMIIFSANIEDGGICYRMYPHSLFNEKINENVNSEMARQPLLVSNKT